MARTHRRNRELRDEYQVSLDSVELESYPTGYEKMHFTIWRQRSTLRNRHLSPRPHKHVLHS